MLIPLLRKYLRPYAGPLTAVVIFQLIGTIASLYLPALNAEIIDDGVAKGDTAFIISTGGIMLAVTVLQIVCTIIAVYFGARTAMGFGRDVRGALFKQVGSFSDREIAKFGAPTLITRNTNDVQQVQMLVLMTCTLLVSAPIMCIGGIYMALRTDLGLAWLLLVSVPVLDHRDQPGRGPDDPAVPAHAGPDRRGQPGAAGADHRCPGGACLRPGTVGDQAVCRRQPGTDGHRGAGRPVDGTDVPDRHAGAQRVQRRRAVVRRAPDRQRGHRDRRPHRLSQLPDADPVLRDDGDVHGRDGAAGVGQRRPDQRGAGHADSSVVPPTTADLAEDQHRRGAAWIVSSSATPAPSAPVLRDINLLARPGTTTAIIGSTGAGKTTLLSLIPRLFDATERRRHGRRSRMSATTTRKPSGTASVWCRRSRSCSPGPWRPTCATATRTPPTRTCGPR